MLLHMVLVTVPSIFRFLECTEMAEYAPTAA